MTTRYCRNLIKVDVVDDEEEEDSIKILLTPLAPLPCRFSGLSITAYLVGSLGQLLSVYVFNDEKQVVAVEVNKLDLHKKQWEKVHCIEDQVLFLRFPNSVSCPALSELHRGRIYFRCYKHYCYSIADKGLSVTRFGHPNLPVFASTPISVMPNPRIPDSEDSKDTTLLELPQCILGEISHYLALLDYMNFRAVCRVFSTAASVIEWRKALVTTAPWLMLCGDGRNKYTFIDPKFSGRYFMSIPEELAGATVLCTKDGWLLMLRDDDDTMFFFNPFTKAILPCPPLYLGYQALTYHMSSAPTDSNYMVVAIAAEEAGICVYSIHNGDNNWVYEEFEPGSNYILNHNSPALNNLSYYFLGRKGDIFVLDYKEDYFSQPDGCDIQAPCDSFHESFLVNCNEKIHSILVVDQGKWVRVFIYDSCDHDEHTMIWREVETIGKCTMFLSRLSCFSVEAEYEEMEDRIYFPRLNKDSLVFYSLKTGKFHSSDGKDTLTDYADTTEHLLCCWTESRWN